MVSLVRYNQQAQRPKINEFVALQVFQGSDAKPRAIRRQDANDDHLNGDVIVYQRRLRLALLLADPIPHVQPPIDGDGCRERDFVAARTGQAAFLYLHTKRFQKHRQVCFRDAIEANTGLASGWHPHLDAQLYDRNDMLYRRVALDLSHNTGIEGTVMGRVNFAHCTEVRAFRPHRADGGREQKDWECDPQYHQRNTADHQHAAPPVTQVIGVYRKRLGR